MSEPITVDEQNFEEAVLRSKAPVLVDSWAPWCGLCRALGPILDQIAAEHEGKLLVAKLNVDENQRLAADYRISSISAMKIFTDGEVVRELTGAIPKSQVEQHLEGTIEPHAALN